MYWNGEAFTTKHYSQQQICPSWKIVKECDKMHPQNKHHEFWSQLLQCNYTHPYKNKHCRIGAALFPIVSKLLFKQGLLMKQRKNLSGSISFMCFMLVGGSVNDWSIAKCFGKEINRGWKYRNYRPNNYVPIQITLCYCVSCSSMTKYYTYPPTHWI